MKHGFKEKFKKSCLKNELCDTEYFFNKACMLFTSKVSKLGT